MIVMAPVTVLLDGRLSFSLPVIVPVRVIDVAVMPLREEVIVQVQRIIPVWFLLSVPSVHVSHVLVIVGSTVLVE